MSQENYAIILAGGKGSRFWPLSREIEPKQFMKVFGNMSLLQATVSRLRKLIDPKRIYIVANKDHFFELRNQIGRFGIPEANIVIEPTGKNTAVAAGLCARLIEQIDKDATLLILPSDHYIKDSRKFKDCLKRALSCARAGFLVTVGIKPRSPSAAYGYIKINKRLKNKKIGYFPIVKFLEKPTVKKAKVFLKNKDFFWNSGIFAWKASVFLGEIKKYLPDLYSQLSLIKSKDDIERMWHKVSPISLDYGIMEHSKRIALIPSDFYWTDLGSWSALSEILPKDRKGNIIQADSLDLDSRGVSIFSRSSRLIATVALKDLIIVDTPDALLVCNRDNDQEVRTIVDNLKSLDRKERLVHLTEKRPWGSYTILQAAKGFKIKLIEISPGKRLSLQRHKKRVEHWVVLNGFIKVTIRDKVSLVRDNQSVYIPKGIKHRLENPNNFPVKLVEVQTGRYLEEDDIERFSDDFKR